MRTLRPIPWAIVVLICALCCSAVAEPTNTTVCKLIKDPARFSGKMVRIRAQVKSGFEVAVILAECDHRGVGMALYYPDLVRGSDRPDFTLLKNASFEEFNRALSKFGLRPQIGPASKPPEGHVFATLVGRFDGPDKLAFTDSAGKTVVRKGYGFSPSTLYQTRLVLKSVSSVAICR
ncbi:MAG TPA: hypothetical protein VNM47_15570 [Terriglobia bacterium]|nr:hypothetical protein [Terriglobia bacterium]